MFRFNRAVCVVLVCAIAGVALGKAVRSKELIAAGAGADLNPDVSGMIVMNFHDSNTPSTEIVVKVDGLAPFTTYGVQVMPGFTNPLAFTTGGAGSGAHHAKVSLPIDISEFAVVRIFEWDGLLITMGQVSYEELRAFGCTSEECNVKTCTTDAECDIGSPCHVDSCIDGLCYSVQNPDICYDGNNCTKDYCSIAPDGSASCFNPPACPDDYDPCTTDVCTGDLDEYGNPICEYIPIPDCP